MTDSLAMREANISNTVGQEYTVEGHKNEVTGVSFDGARIQHPSLSTLCLLSWVVASSNNANLLDSLSALRKEIEPMVNE